jgi:hypothetical protein
MQVICTPKRHDSEVTSTTDGNFGENTRNLRISALPQNNEDKQRTAFSEQQGSGSSRPAGNADRDPLRVQGECDDDDRLYQLHNLFPIPPPGQWDLFHRFA